MPWLSLAKLIGPWILCAILAGTTWFYKARYESAVLKHETFVLKVEAVGEHAKAENLRKEKEYADKINAAVAGRRLALDGLRHALNSGSGTTPLVTKPAEGSTNFCPDTQALAAAVERYRQRVRGLVGEGDAAQIDAQSLIESWPK